MTDRGDRRAGPTRPPARARWGRLSPLGRDISVVLAIKLAALALLWWAFFSHPVAPGMTVAAPRVAAHLVPASTPEQSPHADH
jgi:hypothetical protein